MLYPPHALYKDITDEKLFMELAPTNDDVWFWIMSVLNDTRTIVVKNSIKRPIIIEETFSGPCLCEINNHGEKLHDIQRELSRRAGLSKKFFPGPPHLCIHPSQWPRLLQEPRLLSFRMQYQARFQLL